MTLLGGIFVPLILACFLFWPLHLLPLLLIASVFEAGSVFNGSIGDFDFGIPPFYLIEIFIFLRLAMLLIQSKSLRSLLPRRSNPLRPVAGLLLAFWAWCFVSAFVMPRLFAGISVSVPRGGGEEEFAPLHWSLSNLAQAIYLTLNVGAIFYALFVVRTRRHTEQLINGLYWAIAIVVVIGFGQFVAAKAGWDFPYETLNNNPGYAQGYDQDLGVGLLRRINSTFIEPSMAGSYLAAVTCGLLASFLSGERGLGKFLALMSVSIVLLLTTSSTGFVSLAVGVSLLVVFFNPFRGRHHDRRSSILAWSAILAVFGVAGYLLLSSPDLLDAVLATTVEKGESYSFWLRLANEIHSVQLTFQSYGIGVGLGSNRSSGLLPTALSSIGLVGTGLFIYTIFKIGKAFPGKSARGSLQLVYWALITMLISEVVAVPDINRPVMWGMLLLVIAHFRVELDPSVAKMSADGESRAPRVLRRQIRRVTSPNDGSLSGNVAVRPIV